MTACDSHSARQPTIGSKGPSSSISAEPVGRNVPQRPKKKFRSRPLATVPIRSGITMTAARKPMPSTMRETIRRAGLSAAAPSRPPAAMTSMPPTSERRASIRRKMSPVPSPSVAPSVAKVAIMKETTAMPRFISACRSGMATKALPSCAAEMTPPRSRNKASPKLVFSGAPGVNPCIVSSGMFRVPCLPRAP